MIKILCRIRALRKEKKLTQEELAEKLGISRQSIISVEAGKSIPSLSLAIQIADLFNKAIEEVFSCDFYNPNNFIRKEQIMNRDLMPWRNFGVGRFFDDDSGEIDWPKSISTPAIDVYEKENTVIVEVQLPGINPQDVSIDVSDNTVKISVQKKEEQEEKDKNFYHREISYGSFVRSVTLPTKVKSDKTEAEYNDGILKISLPKEEVKEAKSIRISVKKK